MAKLWQLPWQTMAFAIICHILLHKIGNIAQNTTNNNTLQNRTKNVTSMAKHGKITKNDGKCHSKTWQLP